VAEPNRKHLSNAERLAKIRGPEQRARIATQALEDSQVKIPILTISDQVAEDLLGGRGKELQSAIDANLKPQSRDLGARAELSAQNEGLRHGVTYNVAGLVEGSDPKLKSETIVFSAHYDHDGPAPDGTFYPGADDDGSGTVGVVELARAFARNDIKPRRSLLFVVFAAEERGLLGSYYYVAHPLRPLETTRAVINFDMIGRDETPSRQTEGVIEIAPDTTNELNLIGTNYSPQYRELVERANNMIGLKLNYKWDQEPALNIFFRSDQYPFTLRDIPAVWWFTGFHPDYHQTTDTVDRIDFPKMEKILKLAYVAGFELGDTPEPPAFKP
jgi:Zn-dependent M28 family amino/carboxypeptidase